MRNVNIIKTLVIAIALPALAGAATRRYVVSLSTEPAVRFAGRSFGERRESLSRPEIQTHRTRIRTEQDRVAAKIRELGGKIVARNPRQLPTRSAELNVFCVDSPLTYKTRAKDRTRSDRASRVSSPLNGGAFETASVIFAPKPARLSSWSWPDA